MQTQQQYQIFQQQQAKGEAARSSSAVAAFAARLLSLSAHELAWLHEDGDLMRRFSDAQLHMESRLQTNQNKLYLQQQSYYDLYCRQQQQQSQHHHQALLLQAQHQQHLQHQAQSQLVLDLSAGSQASSGAAANSNKRAQPQQQPLKQQHNHNRSNTGHEPPAQRPFNPKKMKLSEYQQLHQPPHQPPHQPQRFHASPSEREHETAAELLALARGAPDTPETSPQQTLSSPAPPTSTAAAATKQQAVTATRKQAKKYKGEFDEPTPEEVERRQRALANPANYHRAIGQPDLGECACVLGSHFRDNRSVEEMLQIIERWRQLPAAERALTKWDVEDLPLDIPLGDIKKYEDLRRQASRGRADFGGASKRKPLGIRGTRQFLLILYCLWGHPGRDDVMQREGYCPHCFAKIKKDNEQSTLVRVVNHFNMKHRRGANPRLSPHLQRDTNTTTAASSTTTSGAASPVGAISPQTTTTVVSSSSCVKVETPAVVVSSCAAELEGGSVNQQPTTTTATIAAATTPTSSSTTTISA